MAAHFVNRESEGERPHWREFVADSEGYFVAGIGDTKEAAEADAAQKLMARNAFLAQPAETQLAALVSQKELSHFDMNRAIRLIAEIVL